MAECVNRAKRNEIDMNFRRMMNHTQLAVTCLAVTTFVMGCKPSAQREATESREARAQQFDKVKKETQAAAQKLADYSYAQKGEFVAKMRRNS